MHDTPQVADDEEDTDAEKCAALACKDALLKELQALVDALTELEAQAAEATDPAKKAVLLVQCRMAANILKVGHGSIHRTPIELHSSSHCYHTLRQTLHVHLSLAHVTNTPLTPFNLICRSTRRTWPTSASNWTWCSSSSRV